MVFTRHYSATKLDRRIGESLRASPDAIAPRPSQRSQSGGTDGWMVQVVRTPRGGFGLGCWRRYGRAPTPVRRYRRTNWNGCGRVADERSFGEPLRSSRTLVPIAYNPLESAEFRPRVAPKAAPISMGMAADVSRPPFGLNFAYLQPTRSGRSRAPESAQAHWPE
jgi:hypothetical protein